MDAILFLNLTTGAWFTIVVILTVFTLLIATKLDTAAVFMGAVTALFIGGVLTMDEAFGGFSSSSVISIAVLYVVIAGLTYTGVLQWIARNMLGLPKTFSQAILRLTIPAAILSSFLSNVAVVALFINVVKEWSKKLGISPSKLLIPLSYASGMGGVCTLIGTPPNLIISGMYAESTGEQLGFFTTTGVGLFCLFIGILSIILLKRLLPERKSPTDSFENPDCYTVELMVPTDNKFVGMSMKETGLLEIPNGKLIELIRFDQEVICPVEENEYIFGGDRLIFSGQIEELLALKKSHGLVTAANHVYSASELDKNRKIQTAYVTFTSHLINKTLDEIDFENKYGVVLVAIARQGERLEIDPRKLKLKAGDTLLIEGKKLKQEDFQQKLQFTDSQSLQSSGKKTILSASILIAMIALTAFNVLPLVGSALLAAFAMLFTRCCNIKQAKECIDWNLLMIFAGSICLGQAITKTGLAHQVADGLLEVCGTNPYIVLFGLCLTATFLTEFVSNTACGAIFYPISAQAALTLGCNPLTFAVALMVSVSSSFATPIGSSTHMLVYGPGGYRFSDFFRIGMLMNLIILVANIFITTILFPL